jgi:hypothetical protein
LSIAMLFAACAGAHTPAPVSAAANANAAATGDDAHVQRMLVDSCYPCHANERSDPWYAHLAPSSWSSRGRALLNFDEWPGYDPAKRSAELAAIAAAVRDGYMPLKDYTFFNPAAKLNKPERQEIVRWASALAVHGAEGTSR